MKYKVSIVIPCYNRQTLIGDAIESSLNQGRSNIEIDIVVIDDGSTDNSWNVIRSFGNRITARRTNNSGVASARNTGVSLSEGDWIKFLDSDDALLEGSIALQLKQLSGLSRSEMPVGQLGNQKGAACTIKPSMDFSQPITDKEISSKSLQVSQPLFSKFAISDVGGFRHSSISEDYELIFRCVLAGWGFVSFPEPVVYFRDHDDPARLSKNVEEGRFEEVAEVFERLLATMTDLEVSEKSDLYIGLGRNAWSLGRRAARQGHSPVASRLFRLGEAAGGRESRNAKYPVSVLYRLLDPVRVELLLEKIRRRA